jgi:hypothetical protein
MLKSMKTLGFMWVISLAVACGGGSSGGATPAATPAPAAASVTLAVGDITDSGTVTVPVSVNATQASPAGVQFDVQFDASKLQFVSVNIGTAGSNASKTVTTNVLGGNQGVRVLIFGVNENTIANGTVANVVFNTIGNSGDQVAVSLANVTSSDATAKVVSTTQSGGTVTIR